MENLNTISDSHKNLDNLIRNGYKMRIWFYISSAFRIYKKYFWGFLGFSAIFMVISLVVSLPLSYGNTLSKLSETYSAINPWLSFLIFSPIQTIITFIFITGFFTVSRKINNIQKPVFDDFFDGFRFWKQLSFSALIIYIFTFLFYTLPSLSALSKFYVHFSLHNPTYYPSSLSISNIYIIISLLLIGLYFTISFKWTSQFIIFRKMNFYNAILTSQRIITKRWFSFLLYFITLIAVLISPILLIVLLSYISMHLIPQVLSNPDLGYYPGFPTIIMIIFIGILFIVWILLVLPVFYISLYSAFEDIIGTQENENVLEASSSNDFVV